MNRSYKNIFFSCVWFFCCSNNSKILTINNPAPELPDPVYSLNLQSDSGKNPNSVTISWNKTEGNIEIDGEAITNVENNLTFDLKPGEFREIIFHLINSDSTYKDTIQIFSRPLFPVTEFYFILKTIKIGYGVWNEWEKFYDKGNGKWDDGEYFEDTNEDGVWNENEIFQDQGNGIWNDGEYFNDLDTSKYHRILQWSPTIEKTEYFSNYTIYRSDDPSNLIEPGNCDCEIASISSLTDSIYIDSVFQDDPGYFSFFYRILVSGINNKESSYIYGYTSPPEITKIDLIQDNVSMNHHNYIKINWSPIEEINYFYQYEIWRSSNIEKSDTTLIAIIKNPSSYYFSDRNVGNGTSWYYSVATVDISGRKKFSNFIMGWTMP